MIDPTLPRAVQASPPLSVWVCSSVKPNVTRPHGIATTLSTQPYPVGGFAQVGVVNDACAKLTSPMSSRSVLILERDPDSGAFITRSRRQMGLIEHQLPRIFRPH